MNASFVAGAAAGAWALALLPSLADRRLRTWNHIEENYRGDLIPQSYGIVLLLGAPALLVAAAASRLIPPTQLATWTGVILGFGLLGLLDDLRGEKRTRGLRGHFRAAFVERRITTGFIKAIGGGLLALLLAAAAHGRTGDTLICAALIALSANAVNLLDLRPGRAGSVFLVAATVILLACPAARSVRVGLICVSIAALPIYLRDRSARVMMGDTGSNPLGACLGLALALQHSAAVRGAALAALLVLHLVAERVSISRLIERFRPLRALDRLTGIR